MLHRTILSVLGLGLIVSLAACSDYKDSGGKTASQRNTSLESKAASTVAKFKANDPTMKKFFDSAAGYAVFPTVTQGSFIVGGAHSDGVLYENGKPTGYLDVAKASIGLQIEGQQYSQIIFYETAGALGDLKRGEAEALAEASAVIADKGAGASADYEGGVAVFVFGEAGAALKAAVGGQKFYYTPRK